MTAHPSATTCTTSSRQWPEAQHVDEDTLVDVGHGVHVLVAAGDAVPADSTDKPRRPRDGKAKGRRR